MSECVFTLAQLLTIVVIERCARAGNTRRAWLYAALGAALASFTFLTRSVALALVVAGLAYLLKERLVRSALIFAAGVALCVGPWMLYARQHAPTLEQQMEQGGNIVQSYATQLWQKTAGVAGSGTISAGELPARIWDNAMQITQSDIGALAVYLLFRPLEPGEMMKRVPGSAGFSLFLTALMVAGFIFAVRQRLTVAEFTVPLSLMITLVWGWEQFRFLLPLLPFLLFYLLMGLRLIQSLHHRLQGNTEPRLSWMTVTVVVWCLVALNVQGNVKYLFRQYDPASATGPTWVPAFAENEEVIKWVGERLGKKEILAAQNPALLHLYTGHKTVASDDSVARWETWRRLGVRYQVRTSPYPLPDPDPAESKYKAVYRSPGRLRLRVLDFGAQEARAFQSSAGTAEPIRRSIFRQVAEETR
jgi:hypothetical protein